MKFRSCVLGGEAFDGVKPDSIVAALAKLLGEDEYVSHTISTHAVTFLGVTMGDIVYVTVACREKDSKDR